ncbi:hypothetical protein TYRP_013757 [Tyrophagus putrescentiae]|nr:hypothetical protein TYRP_013757 [Tyrophagus putrescentiae]
MVKAHLLFLVGITSAFLLTVQLIALQYLVHQGTIEEPAQWKRLDAVTTAASAVTCPSSSSTAPSSRSSTTAATSLSCPLDQQRQQQILEDRVEQARAQFIESRNARVDGRSCRVFLRWLQADHPPGDAGRLRHPEVITRLTAHLREHHDRLTVISLTDVDPTLAHLALHVTIPTHLMVVDEDVDIRKEPHVVHITVLHDRLRGRYWWAAPLKMTEAEERILHRQGLKRNVFHTPFSSSIFAKTEILRTTIDGLPLYLPLPADPFLVPPPSRRFLECNLKRAGDFYAAYPREDTAQAAAFRAKATALLTKVRHLLEDTLRIPFWLSSGTLLGYYRQCDYIVYSGDVDIGVWAEDFRPELVEAFSTANLPLIHWFGRPNDSLELSFVNGAGGDLKLDIFFFYRNTTSKKGNARTGLKFRYDFPPFSLCWTEFVGLLLRIPCETERYLEANYGKDWATPVRGWDWKTSPPNVRPNGQWQPHEWPETIRLMPIPGPH